MLRVLDVNHGSTFSRLIVNDLSISIKARVFSNSDDGLAAIVVTISEVAKSWCLLVLSGSLVLIGIDGRTKAKVYRLKTITYILFHFMDGIPSVIRWAVLGPDCDSRNK
jgi:hypothetical protein